MSETVKTAAQRGYGVGLCLLPVADDGTKQPALSTWKSYKTTRPTPDEMRAFNFALRRGLGMVAGSGSEYRECWDFDDADTFEAFVAAARATGLGAVVDRIRAGYEDATPGGGRRWIVAYPSTVTWSDCTLARRLGREGETKVKTLIELPTFAILAPSHGGTHPSGKAYTRVSGDVDTIASYTADERAALFSLARSFDEIPRQAAMMPKSPMNSPTVGTRPGDLYASRTTWAEILEPAGWQSVYMRGETTYWRRPGKAQGVSATTNHAGADLLYIFTSSTAFDAGTSYTKFGAYAVLHHDGDFSLAAAALTAAGRQPVGLLSHTSRDVSSFPSSIQQDAPRRGDVGDPADVTGPHDGEASHESMDSAVAAVGFVPLGRRDPRSGRIVLSPTRTLPTAEAYVREFHHHVEGRLLHAHAGLLLDWRDNRYVEIEETAIKCQLLLWLHQALRYVVRRSGETVLKDFDANPTTVRAALDSIRAYSYLPADVIPPVWLDRNPHPPALEVVPCRSLNVHVPTREILPATPALFTTNALDFDYDPAAAHPALWLDFLAQIWPDDQESVDLLQEWFGYCLIADTSQQKMLLLVGPRRSGKGTIGRILGRLVGPANVVGPTTSSLAMTFGLQPLIGKSLAIVSDARFSGENVSTVVERLLCISGEDALSVDRKFLGAITIKLPTRFVFLTNELPRLTDASTALAGRFLILQLTESFYGREDPALTTKLCSQLPGILNWALAGWERLAARGRFEQPGSVRDAVEELEDLGSPIKPFVRDCCAVMPGLRVPVDTLYATWEMWCKETGSKPGTRQAFGRDLKSAAHGVKRRRANPDGSAKDAFYEGIGITSETAEAVARFVLGRTRTMEPAHE